MSSQPKKPIIWRKLNPDGRSHLGRLCRGPRWSGRRWCAAGSRRRRRSTAQSREHWQPRSPLHHRTCRSRASSHNVEREGQCGDHHGDDSEEHGREPAHGCQQCRGGTCPGDEAGPGRGGPVRSPGGLPIPRSRSRWWFRPRWGSRRSTGTTIGVVVSATASSMGRELRNERADAVRAAQIAAFTRRMS
jgi:hypothetical protein